MKNKRNFIKRYWIRLTMVILIITGILMGIYARHNHELRVCGGDQCFVVEAVRTPVEQQKGLMFRESLDSNSGMLFVFDASDIHNFRMKNTLIPLDMLRIDGQFQVVRIMTAQPCTADPCPVYQPGKEAKYVLEINAGQAAKHGITEGTKMRLVNIQ